MGRQTRALLDTPRLRIKPLSTLDERTGPTRFQPYGGGNRMMGGIVTHQRWPVKKHLAPSRTFRRLLRNARDAIDRSCRSFGSGYVSSPCLSCICRLFSATSCLELVVLQASEPPRMRGAKTSTMISTCANPNCRIAFSPYSGGRFFRFPQRVLDATQLNAHRVTHHWLFQRCSVSYSIVHESMGGTSLREKEAINQLPDLSNSLFA